MEIAPKARPAGVHPRRVARHPVAHHHYRARRADSPGGDGVHVPELPGVRVAALAGSPPGRAAPRGERADARGSRAGRGADASSGVHRARLRLRVLVRAVRGAVVADVHREGVRRVLRDQRDRVRDGRGQASRRMTGQKIIIHKKRLRICVASSLLSERN